MFKIIAFIITTTISLFAQQIKISINQFSENWQNDSVKILYIEETDCNESNKDCKGFIKKYDSLGRLIENTEYEDGEYDGKTIFNYNNFGKLCLMEKYDEDNKLDDKEIYTYDSSGKIIEFKDLDSEGKVDRLLKYQYLSKDTMKIIQYNSHNSIENKIIYTDKDKHGKYLTTINSNSIGEKRIKKRKIQYLEK